jgi:hypothetical protein
VERARRFGHQDSQSLGGTRAISDQCLKTTSYRDSEEFPREMELAKNKLVALGSSLRTVLQKIYKIASQTFHVLLWDLIPGARMQKSHKFTRVRESRNQHLIRAREANDILQVRHHTAKDTFFEVHLEALCQGQQTDDLQAI